MEDLRDLLKSGRVIEVRDGRKYLICGDIFMNNEGYLNTTYNSKLQNITDKQWDIMQIYSPMHCSLNRIFKGFGDAKLIWSCPKERPSNLKSLLQTGMRVTTRDGDTYIVLRGPAGVDGYELMLSNKDNFLPGYRYNNALQHVASNGYDIIRIERVFRSSLAAMLVQVPVEVIYDEE